MRIAICDDNVADRKQLERLLSRESIKRADTDGILFVDSFGNYQALLNCPQSYDCYFVDICDSPEFSGEMLIQILAQRGIQSPVIFMCSKIDYRTQNLPESVLFLNKPIKVAELSTRIDICIEALKHKEPLIELRLEQETLYVREAEILYAEERKKMLHVHLTENRVAECKISNANFFAEIEQFESFLEPGDKLTINARHIREFHGKKVTMTDGAVFKLPGKFLDYAQTAQAKYQ